MSQTAVNLRIDADLKKNLDSVLAEMGMTISTAFMVFAKKLISEHNTSADKRTSDPFYDESNIRILESRINDMNMGINVSEHELIKV